LTKVLKDLPIIAQKRRDEAKALVDQVPGATELKRQIEDLTSYIDLYEKRGQTYTSVTSESSDSTFTSISGVASGSRQGTLQSLPESSDFVTDPNRHATLDFVTEETNFRDFCLSGGDVPAARAIGPQL